MERCFHCGYSTNDAVWCESPEVVDRCFLLCWFCFQGYIYDGRFVAPVRVWRRHVRRRVDRPGSWPVTCLIR